MGVDEASLVRTAKHSIPAQGSVGLYTHIIRHRWSMAVVAVVASVSALYFSRQQTPIYESETTVLIEPITLSEGSEPFQEPNLSTEERLAVSIPIAEQVVDRIELSETPMDLLRNLAVESVPGADMLIFRYEHPDPGVAAQRSQAFADSYLEARQQLVAQHVSTSLEALQEDIRTLNRKVSRLTEQIPQTEKPARGILQSRASLLSSLLVRKEIAALQLMNDAQVGSIVEPAARPSSPIRPNHRLNVVLGLVLGLLLGAGQAVLRGRLSRRIWSIEELEAIIGEPVLGAIPGVRTWRRRPATLLMTNQKAPQDMIEAFRFLRESVTVAASARGAKVLLVTSVDAGEGRSITAVNLAIALSKVGKRVVLVSADLRRSALDDLLLFSDRPGLIDVLAGEVPQEAALVPHGIMGMRLLPHGRKVEDPAELLASVAMKRLLDDLRRDSDFVILDSPPVSGVADTIALAPATDGVVLVVDARRGDAASVRTASRQLEQVGVPLIGAVFNRADLARLETRSYYHAQESSMYREPQPSRTAANGVRPVRSPAERTR